MVLKFGHAPVQLCSCIPRHHRTLHPSPRLQARLARRKGNADVFQSISPACVRPRVLSGVGRPSTCHGKGAPSVVRDRFTRAMISVCWSSRARTRHPSRWGWRECDGQRRGNLAWNLWCSPPAMRPDYRTSSPSWGH